MMRPARLLVLVLGLCVAVTTASADERVERLAALGRVWGQARYSHPYLSTRTLDWDAPLLAAIPKARAATSDQEFVAAVDEMLRALGDPVTRVVPPPAPSATGPARAVVRRVGTVVVVDLTALEGRPLPEIHAAFGTVAAALADAPAVVFDLRFASDAPGWVASMLEYWTPLLVPADTLGPGMRALVHDGYAPQGGMPSSGGYSTYAKTLPGAPYRRDPSMKPASAQVRAVYLTNPQVLLDAGPWAAQRSGHGFVVAQGAARYAQGNWTELALPGGRLAAVRTTEWTELPFGADVTVPARRDGLTTALALARKRGPIKPRAVRTAPLPPPRVVADAPYRDQVTPSLELRMLALFRVWNVIDRFYPYLSLIPDWKPVLAEFIPRFEAATTADSYAAALLELSTRVPDGHTVVAGHPGIARVLRGEGFLDVELRWIEQQAVVTSLGAPAAAAGLAVGDVIIAVDGEPMAARVARMLPLTSASTEATRYRNVMRYAVGGPVGEAVFRVRRADGTTREVRAARTPTWSPRPPTTPAFRLIGADLGYVSLKDLSLAEVDPMFEAMKATKAIIFDMRGYPQGTAWAIAPRLNTRQARHAAMFHRRVLDPSQDGGATTTVEFLQPMPPTTGWIYRGKTVMLIDDRTQSQAEHTGLFFEAANGTIFIGTPSAGTNGDVTAMALAGGAFWMFTGHDVRHADGRQLQRLGLQPTIQVAPTLAGIRAGKDEVLDRAITYLRTGR